MHTIDDLKLLPQWVGHRNKIPINPNTGNSASTIDPQTWTTAQDAWRAKSRYRLDGIGFVFTLKTGVVGIDLDDCFVDGVLKPQAQDIVSCVNSYTELSPSGRGIHILAAGTIPHSISRDGVEMYNEMRYFTMTGNQYESIGYVADRQKELDGIFAVFGDWNEERPLPKVAPATRRETSIDDVRAALAVMPVWGDYASHWLRVLMAVHDAFPDETGVSLIEAWSPGKKGEVRRKFRSFERTGRDGVTIATLFHMAKEYGYKPQGAPAQATRPQAGGNNARRFDLRGAL